jgi:hypothetical protein
MLSVTASNLTEYCSLMQQKIINTLEFDSPPEIVGNIFLDNNRYVGLYGNSDISKTGDWVKVLYQNRIRPTVSSSSSSCSGPTIKNTNYTGSYWGFALFL